MVKDIANKLKNNIELETSKLKDIPTLTCSFGVVYMGDFTSFSQAYKTVDKKLYLAKKMDVIESKYSFKELGIYQLRVFNLFVDNLYSYNLKLRQLRFLFLLF